MHFLATIILFGLIAALQTFASPVFLSSNALTSTTSLSPFTERDLPCNPEIMTQGQDYYDCPKKNTLDSDGHCSDTIPDKPDDEGCTAYCEIKLSMTYGQEIPVDSSSCQSETSCNVQKGYSFTVTNSYEISAGGEAGSGEDISKSLTATFNVGASYTHSESVGYTLDQNWRKDVPKGTCGYWTFIPHLITSCGTLTSAHEYTHWYPRLLSEKLCDKTKLKDTANWCNTTPYKDTHDNAGGKNVFVYTNCDTNEPWEDGQDPAYDVEGVSIARNRAPGGPPSS